MSEIKFNQFGVLLIALVMILTGCSSAGTEVSPTPNPETVMTAAAQTAEARLTEIAKSTTSPTPVSTTTSLPSPDAGVTGVPETSPPEGIPTLTPTVEELLTGTDKAAYVMDVTVPDSTEFNSGETFTKVWRLSNIGSSTWSTSYRLTFIGGAQMGGNEEASIPVSVPPGSTVDVEVELVAPEANGTYRGFWSMKNSAGTLFDNSVYLEIVVVGGSDSEEPPPSTSGDAVVSDLSLRVEDEYVTECPNEFLFSITFKLNKPASVTYQLEAGSNTPGFEFALPAPVTGNFDAGTHVVSFNLQLTDSVDGWAQLHISAPNDAYSNQEAFTLDCGGE
jgi:hypothetical protein